jgi:hypothetical protein
VLRLGLLGGVLLAVLAVSSAQAAPTNAEFVAQADAICKASAKKDIRGLVRSRKLIEHGKLKQGGRLLISTERFELKLYGEIAALERPVDPAFNEQVEIFLTAQRGQAHARIKVGRGFVRGKYLAHYDDVAIGFLKAAGKAAEQLGFTQC